MQPRERPLTFPQEDVVRWDIENPAGYANRCGVYKTRVESEFIRAHLPPQPATILDIAGGSGRFSLPLLRDGYAVTSNDINLRSLQILQERGEGLPLSILHGDFLQVPVSGKFDAALAIECLENLPTEQAVSRVRDLLKPGGVFVCAVINAGSWRFAVRGIVGRAQAGEQILSTQEYCAVFDRLGFDIVATRGFMWTPFIVTSNSPLVPVFANLEHMLGLSAIPSQSPWLMIAAKRRP